jgi:hypothetical protein
MRYVALLLLLGLAPLAHGAELATTQDGSRILVNKDVNGERWAITYDLTRQAVTGNVLLPNGDATFLECSANPGDSDVDLYCDSFHAGSWTFLARATLPKAFFGLGQSACPNGPPGVTTVTYSDSCGINATATFFVGPQDRCHKDAPLDDASDPRLEGAQLVADFDSTGGVAYSLTFHGACQGTARGTGRVVDSSDADWRAEGTLTGDASCCHGLQASIGLQ